MNSDETSNAEQGSTDQSTGGRIGSIASLDDHARIADLERRVACIEVMIDDAINAVSSHSLFNGSKSCLNLRQSVEDEHVALEKVQELLAERQVAFRVLNDRLSHLQQRLVMGVDPGQDFQDFLGTAPPSLGLVNEISHGSSAFEKEKRKRAAPIDAMTLAEIENIPLVPEANSSNGNAERSGRADRDDAQHGEKP